MPGPNSPAQWTASAEWSRSSRDKAIVAGTVASVARVVRRIDLQTSGDIIAGASGFQFKRIWALLANRKLKPILVVGIVDGQPGKHHAINDGVPLNVVSVPLLT